MDLYDLLDRPIAYHRPFVTLTKSVTAAVMLSQAVYWARRTDETGWFYKTRDEWQEETGLSRTEQETARKVLLATGFWQEERRGVPAKMFYRVDKQALAAAIKALPSSRRETCQLESGKPANKAEGNLPTTKDRDYTETTSERGRVSRFTPPSIEECREEALKNQIPEEEGDAFFDRHSTNGWIPTGQRTQMKDWHAAMRTWKRNFLKFGKPAPSKGQPEQPDKHNPRYFTPDGRMKYNSLGTETIWERDQREKREKEREERGEEN